MLKGIRFKLLAVLLLGSILPLALGVLSLQIFGTRYYRRTQGLLFQGVAGRVAQTLSISINTQVEKLSDWITLSNLPARVRSTPAPERAPDKIATLDRDWPHLQLEQPPLSQVLQSDLAMDLRQFMRLNPFYRELIVTDARGLLVAASGKTSDYLQSDEKWWKNVRELPANVASFEGITYDASAKTYSLDIAFPLREKRSRRFLGAIKGSLDVSGLYLAMPRGLVGETLKREVVMSDGRILSRMDDATYSPLRDRYEDFGALLEEQRNRNEQRRGGNESARTREGDEQGWTVAPLRVRSSPRGAPAEEQRLGRQLLGFAALRLESVGGKIVPIAGVRRMYVMVHQSQSEALAPIRSQLWKLSLGGGVFLMGLALFGFWLAERSIVEPLRVLAGATEDLAHTASLEPGVTPDADTRERARRAIAQCRALNSGDEISVLAGDFAAMGEQILNYHDRLQADIAEKAGTILRDLEMAREFQVSLVPREYPRFDPVAVGDATLPLRLSFQHLYQPALEIGGDFFDVYKISETQAGVFLADVMQHGTRSALVTSILKTLLQDFWTQTSDPSELMRLMNRHFYEITRSSRQSVVVSAFCLVLDIQKRQVTYANAGHPSPLFAEGATARVLPLLGHAGDRGIHTNATLGAAMETTYRRYERSVAPGDTLLVYTDGLVGAPNPQGDDFSMSQLENVVSNALARESSYLDVAALCEAVAAALDEWRQGTPLPDDVCLIAVGM